jgi:hypothetical protein
MTDGKPTHGDPHTLSYNDASIRAKVLVEALRDVIRPEEAYRIAEDHLSQAYIDGFEGRPYRG